MKVKGRLEFQAVLVEGLGTRHPATAILTHLWSVVCTRQVFSAFDSGELFAYIYLWNEMRRFLGVRDLHAADEERRAGHRHGRCTDASRRGASLPGGSD